MNNPQKPSKCTALSRLWRPKWILLWAGLAAVFCLGYLFFWPWDEPPPQDADLRQLEKSPPCAPEDNAWLLLMKAQRRIVNEITITLPPANRQPKGPETKTVVWRGADIYIYKNFDNSQFFWRQEIVNEAISANAAVFRLVDQAISRRGCASPAPIAPRPIETIELLELNYLLRIKATNEQVAGNHAEATKTVLQRLRIAQMICENLDQPTEHGISYLGDAMTGDWGCLVALLRDPGLPDAQLEQLADGMKPWLQDCLTAHIRNDIRNQYMKQSARLLEPSQAKEWLDWMEATGKPIPPWCFKPRMTCRKLADITRILLDKAGQPDQQVKAMTFQKPTHWQIVSRMFRLNGLGDIGLDYQQPLFLRSRTETTYSELRLIIACKRYQRRHGKLPKRLSALVPDFLEAVPTNPFDGQPFGYSADQKQIYYYEEDHLEHMPIDLPPLPPVTKIPLESYVDQLPVPDKSGSAPI